MFLSSHFLLRLFPRGSDVVDALEMAAEDSKVVGLVSRSVVKLLAMKR